jgi:cytochrome c-type biogenesis protein CcsB
MEGFKLFMFIDQYQFLLINLIFVCLLVSVILYWISLIFSKLLIFTQIGKILCQIANFSLFIILANRWLFYGYFPLSNLYESLLFLSWILLFLQTILEQTTYTNKILPSIILPIVLLINTFASLTLPIEMQKANSLVPALQSNWLMMHVSLMMLSYGTLIIGSLLSILFLLLSFSKKNEILLPSKSKFAEKNLVLQETFISFEPLITQKNLLRNSLLENLDSLSYRIISLGFPFLTIGIIAGAVWANEAWGSYWSWDPKETWALITWLVFAAYLHARITKNWRGRSSAILGSLGFFVVWICYLGVNFLGQGLHSYGWLS